MIIMLKILPWILFLGLILTWMPWRSIFERLWGNNPKRAKVYVEAGEQIELCKGKMSTEAPVGARYTYKCFGEWCTVIVPQKYPYRYILGCRQIRVIYGQSTAAPLGGMTDTDIAVSGETLDAIFRAHIGSDLAKTIFGKAVNYMMILMIIGGVLVVGYFLFKQLGPGIVPVQQPGIEQPLQPQQPQQHPLE